MADRAEMICGCDMEVGYCCPAHYSDLAEYRLICWLQERYDNCLRLANQKTDEEKRGWLEDAAYFKMAIEAIREGSNG